MVEVDTKTALLDTAERLFADRGIAATSLRTITSEAGANLAAVHYHFGSKAALVQEVFSRRLKALNEERLRLLQRLQASGASWPPPLEDLLRAFVGPVLRLGLDLDRGDAVMRLLGRLYTEPGDIIQSIITEQFGEVAHRFVPAFASALPELDKEELFWRIHFAIGAMAQTCTDPYRLELISGGTIDASDVEATVDKLVRFLAGGLRAPVSKPAVAKDSDGDAP